MKKLIVTAIGGKIEYATITKSGLIGSDRKDMTNEVIDACLDFFEVNHYRQNIRSFPSGKKQALFYTSDETKMEQIQKILFPEGDKEKEGTK